MNNPGRLPQPFLQLCCISFLLMLLTSCTTKYKQGDFTIIVEEDKYESLGGAVKTDSYDILYKGKEIDWSEHIPDIEKPEVSNFHRLENDPSAILVEVVRNYYLLKPEGNGLSIKRIAEASYRSGVFNKMPYTELLNKGLFFHQAGRLINLKNLHQDTLALPPGGRFLAADNEASTIVYLSGVFDDDTDLEKAWKKMHSAQDDILYGYEPPVNNSTVFITEWDVRNKKTSSYSYTDTTFWKEFNLYYERNKYGAVSDGFDSSFVFGLFKWAQDSIGTRHLIPKAAQLTAIKFESNNVDSLLGY